MYEGLPISFFEAKLHGLKIITTPSSGDFDVLTNEDILLPDFSEASIAGALLDAITQGPISRGNRDAIRSQSSWMNTEYCSREYYKNLTNILFSED
jgi:glycosyltransferase involved in cell wall biosynthesis